ncbi:hypothetical protein DL93DRAFT_2070267 [Clavulina sp. PMI_390]|nr:hypothetical protein DL93DRAFT_2070267 [Clavulina sp. PMI_390]
MDTESPYSPFNRHHRGTEAPQSSARTPLPRKAPPPPSDLGLPNASFLQDLTGSFRNSVTDPPGAPSESVDYEEDEHSNAWGSGSQGLTNGATAAGFYSLAQKVTSSMTSLTSGHQPEPHRQLSNAEIEAEAIREREHSRREAERILLQEAEERRRSEDLLAQQGHVSHLPPLKPRRSTIDVLPPQPGMIGGSKPNSPGQKSGWWSMAKQKLTPNKSQDKDEGPLTPSQAIARDAKMRERESESPTDEEPQDPFRNRKQSWFSPKGKGKDRSDTDLGASPSALPLPISPPAIPQRLSTSPARLVSPMTPPHVPEASQTTQLNFSPTPAPRTSGARPLVERTPTKAPTLASETPSLYTQFHPITGALDVAATLLTVTARFEKLERWTVNHVRALEDRMKDVER